MREASPKQVAFLRTLVAEREITHSNIIDAVNSTTVYYTSQQASDWITWALQQPRKPKAVVVAGTGAPDDLAVALENAVPSKYAIPTAGLQIPGLNLPGDLLFVEVRPWKNRNYLNRLHGAPGSFWRSRFNRSQSLAILAVIAGKHVEFAQLFGQHYTCCGRCGAELTDKRSRETHLGPTCREIFGIV